MKKKLTFLGIETSCDETAAAIVQENGDSTANVLSNIVSSQIKEHKKFGGVVPEIAARSHIENKISFPYLLLLVSGGHSQYLIVKGVNNYKQIGTTIDDAVGEAFDKTAKILNLGYPGGPNVEKFSKLGIKDSFILPQPIINRAGCNLSLAGLKTDVLRKSKNLKSNKERYNLAASFQETVNKILKKKTEVAMKQFRNEITGKSLKYFVVAGGVAANETIRKGLKEVSLKMNFKPIFPSKEFCGDNAAMIAWAGIQRCKKKLFHKKNETVKSRWPLDVKAPFLKGPGLKF